MTNISLIENDDDIRVCALNIYPGRFDDKTGKFIPSIDGQQKLLKRLIHETLTKNYSGLSEDKIAELETLCDKYDVSFEVKVKGYINNELKLDESHTIHIHC